MKQTISLEEATEELAEVGYVVEKKLPCRRPELKLLARKEKDLVTLKIVSKNDYFYNDLMKDYYNNEITLGNKVKNSFPHLVSQYEFFYTKHYAIFVYAYYENGTLGDYFSDQEFNLLQIIILLKDIFLGLEELRSLGYIHRNLHEHNIYVSNLTVKIGGFEHCEPLAAKHMDFNYHLFFLKTLKAVLPSIPPEVALNKCCTVKTSVYCIGSILYRLLYKVPHFKAATLEDVIKVYIEKKRPVFINDLPPDFNKILRRSLEYDQDSRLSPYELKQELSYLLGYCRNFEDEIRISVYLKKTIAAFKNISMRELKEIKLDSHADLLTKSSMQDGSQPVKNKLEAIRTLKIINKRNEQSAKVNQESTKALPFASSAFALEPHHKQKLGYHLVGLEGYRNYRARSIHRAEKVINTSINNRKEAIVGLRTRTGHRSLNTSMNMSNSIGT